MLDVILAAALLPRHAVFGAALSDGAKGTTISRVIPGSAAATAGLQAGDVIVSLDTVPTPNVVAFLAQIHRYHAGDRVTANVIRSGSSQRLAIALGAPADEKAPGLVTEYGSISVDGTLRRTLLTLPADAHHKLPAMLILGGIGCLSVDVAADPQDPYLRLSHDVSRAGFVTMRVEKSGVGDSQGPPCRTVDFQTEQRTYAAALNALKADPRVDVTRIYLFGHSIGSLQAVMLANVQHVAGIIVAEAVGRDWPEYETRNSRRQLELGGDKAPDVDRALTEKQECLVRLLLEKQPESLIEQSLPSCKIHNGVYPVDPPYMQQVATVNVIGQWSRIDVPVLAIYGSSDFVTEQADHERIVEVVNRNHSGTATFVRIAGMDHLLYTEPTPKAAFEAFTSTAPRQYNAALSATIVNWLRSQHRG